jgi:deazaflavin-dependent oxidoreductase (nitroreductase family)
MFDQAQTQEEEPMEQQLPPSGTRGTEIPGFIRPMMKALSAATEGLMLRSGMKMQGRPLMRLTTLGARSGKRRRTMLASFEDGDRPDSWLVVGSNGGSAHHPGWVYNLIKNPDQASVEIGKNTTPVTAQLVTEPERDPIWEEITTLAPGYAKYETKTDRQQPIFRLTAR